MIRLNIAPLGNNILKALMLDVAVTVGFKTLTGSIYTINTELLTSVFSGAYLSYTLRDIARLDYKHQWIGGVIGGAIKYSTKNSSAILGAYNNFGYEFAKDQLQILGDNVPALLIEGTDEMLSGLNKTYYNNNSTNVMVDAGIQGFINGAAIGAMVVGMAYTAYIPLEQYMQPVFSSIPGKVIISTVTFGAILNAGTKLRTEIGDYTKHKFSQLAEHEYVNNLVEWLNYTHDHNEL